MKTTVKRILLAGLALLVVGALISVAALFSMKFDFRLLGTRKTVTNTYTPAGDFDDILISVDTADVDFQPSEDGKLKVVCVEEHGCEHIVSTLSGDLTIQAVDTRKWYEKLGVGGEKTSVTVYLPKKEYGALTLRTSTGDVDIPASFRFQSVLMSGSTADIRIRASVEGSIGIQTSTGSITLAGLRAASLDLQASTGHITVSESVISGAVEARASTGEISFTDLNCTEARVKTSTGDAAFDFVLASESIRAETDTGDVRFVRSDAPDIFVKTNTGDVTGTLLTTKLFEADTDTGKMKLPASGPGGRCRLESDTGDFDISLVG